MFLRSSVLVLPIEMHGAVATRELVMVREWVSLNAKAELARMHRDRHCHETMVLYRPTLESYQRATSQGPFIRGGSLVSPRAGNPKRKRPNCHRSVKPQKPWGGHPYLGRPADYLPSGTVGQWLPAPCNG